MKKLLSTFGASLLCIACTDSTPAPEIPQVHLSQALSRVDLFPDQIERDSLHGTNRDFATDSMLEIHALSDSTVQITNFTPLKLTGIQVLLSLDQLASSLIVMELDTIAPLQRVVLSYPKSKDFPTLDGKIAHFEKVPKFPRTALSLDYLPNSEKLKMLKSIKLNWHVHFNDYAKQQPSHPSWEPIRPAQARLWTALLMNNAYLFSREDYQARFLKEKFYRNMNDTTRAVADSDWFSAAQTQDLLRNNLLKKRRLSVGIVSGGGLGGGTTLGISNGTLTGQFGGKFHDSLMAMSYLPESYYGGPHPMFSHELGHVLGYGHNSNVCSTGRLGPSGTPEWAKMFGFPSLNTLMYGKYLSENALPISKDEYPWPEDFKYSQPAHGSDW